MVLIHENSRGSIALQHLLLLRFVWLRSHTSSKSYQLETTHKPGHNAKGTSWVLPLEEWVAQAACFCFPLCQLCSQLAPQLWGYITGMFAWGPGPAAFVYRLPSLGDLDLATQSPLQHFMVSLHSTSTVFHVNLAKCLLFPSPDTAWGWREAGILEKASKSLGRGYSLMAASHSLMACCIANNCRIWRREERLNLLWGEGCMNNMTTGIRDSSIHA